MSIRQFFSAIVAAFLYMGTLTAIAANQPAFPAWRSPSCDGLNVLYCYLRINGVRCQYSALAAEFAKNPERTALTLEHLAEREGSPLQAVSLTLDELRRCAWPIIVRIDGKTPEEGTFLLVTGIRGRTVAYIMGGSVLTGSVDISSFARSWSGIALVPKRTRAENAACFLSGFFVPFLGALLLRKKKR